MNINLNHINLSVPDVAAARTFFEVHFDFKIADTKPNDTLSVLKGDNGFVLVLMNEKLNEHGNHTYPDAFHFGFYLENAEAVDEKYVALKATGIPLHNEPKQIRKTYGFYFRYQNLLIEIATEVF